MLRLRSIFLFAVALAAYAFASGDGCVIGRIAWEGERTAYDEARMSQAVGIPCAGWRSLSADVVRDYENRGFLAAKVEGRIEGDTLQGATLVLSVVRGAAYVWAAPVNLDSGATKPEVFQRLTGIEEGAPVSPFDLERSERKLSRIGYYEPTAPTRLFRDPSRNRIVPAFSMRRANMSEAEGVLTYSSEENVWEGKLDVNLYNIAGTARDLELEGFTGESTRHLSGSYKEPWIFGTAWNVVVRGRFDEETLDAADTATSDSAGEFVERTLLGEVGVTRDIGFDFSIGVYLGISAIRSTTSLRRQRAQRHTTRCTATLSRGLRAWRAEFSRRKLPSAAPTCLRSAARETSRECSTTCSAVVRMASLNSQSCGRTATT